MKISIICLLTVMVLLAASDTTVAQHYEDWTEFQYLPGRYDSDDHIVFYELQRDYTISLPEYFLIADRLPDCCEDEVGFYNSWAQLLPPCDWDFISLEFGGILTIKKGYRWDGASYPCKIWGGDLYCPDEHHNFRSSLVHDALYDLMRMGYLEADHLDLGDPTTQDDPGDYNRKMADMIHYMIAIEDGDSEDDAQSDYFWLRTFGALATHDDDKLNGWKYHVSDLTAYSSSGEVELTWKRANEAMKDPNSGDHFSTWEGYSIVRDGQEIATVEAFRLISTIPLVIEWITSFTDNTVVDGDMYGYQLIPLSENSNQDDWSNEDIVVPLDGPGNALQLDGIDDYVEANTVSNDLCFELFLNPLPIFYTMEAWVYPEEQTGQAVIMAFNTITGGNYSLLSYNGNTHKFCYYDENLGFVSSSDEFAAGSWYHVAVTVHSLSQANLYVNGVQQATFVPVVRPSHGARFSIGQEWDGSTTTQHFKGMIDEVRIWNVARTQGEIQSDMYHPLRGDETGLVGLWHFDEPPHYRKTYGATPNANDGLLSGYIYSDNAFVPSGAMDQTTDVTSEQIGESVPKTFALNQNYPNPFNPTTTFEFSLPVRSQVAIEVFNILGKKVKTLHEGELAAGTYTITWDGRDNGNHLVASGVYLYRIKTDDFVESKKMLLVK